MKYCVFHRWKCPQRSALVFLLLAATIGSSQTVSQPDFIDMSLEDLANIKVYSASKYMESARQAPSAVSVITADEIAAYGWRTLADALNSLRSFYVSYDRNYAYIGVRGFRQADDYGSRILLMIDGHRVNENIYYSIFVGTDFPLDLALVDRIEVVRGPSSSLYGTNAYFAVINVITRRPQSMAVEAAGDEGTFLSRTGRLTAEIEKSKFSALFSGSMYRSAGPSDLYYPQFDSPATNFGNAINADGDHYAHGFGDLQFGDWRIQGLYGSRMKIVPTASFGTNFNDPGSTTDDSRGYLDVDYHHRLTDQTDLESRLYYDDYQYHGTNPYTGPQGRYLTYDHDSVQWLGTEETLGHTFNDRFRLTTGAKFEYDVTLKEVDELGKLYASRNPWLAATYAELETKLTANVTLNTGGRLDSYSTFGVDVNPRLAVIYTPDDHTTLKYIFGSAFNAPNAYELFYSDGVVISPSHDLGPEHIRSHDVVLERRLNRRLRATVEGYYNGLRDLIELEPDGNTGLQHYVNGGQDAGKGLEFQFDGKGPYGLEGRASYSVGDFVNSLTQQRLSYSPLSLAKLNSTVPVFRGARAGLEMLFTSAQDNYAGARTPSSFLTNVTLSSSPFWGGLRLSASCYNAFNRLWFDPGGPEHVQSMIQQDGRTFRFQLTYRLAPPAERAK